MSIALSSPTNFNSSLSVGSTGVLDWSSLNNGGQWARIAEHNQNVWPMLRIKNESGYGLLIQFPLSNKSLNLGAGAWGDIQFHPDEIKLNWTVLYALSNMQVAQLLGTMYEPGEHVDAIPHLGNSPVATAGITQISNVQTLTNDNQIPNTTVIEATPNDQSTSSIVDRNDASGFRQVLSANVLRKIWNVTRGNSGAGKAVIQFGDSGDTTITNFYGTASNVPATGITAGTLAAGVNEPAANVQPGVYPTGQFTCVAANTVTSIAMLMQSGNTTGAHGDILELVNGVDTTWGFVQGVGDSVQSPFGAGAYLYDLKNGDTVYQNATKFVVPFTHDIQVKGKIATNNATDKGVSFKDNAPNVEFDAAAPASTARGIIFASIDTAGALHAGVEVTSNGVTRVGSNDPTLGNPRIATYIGTTDPASRSGVTVQDGDIWFNI